MSQSDPDDPVVDAMLERLPDWQPPAGFAHRVASLAVAQMPVNHSFWVASVLRALGLAACVSSAAWILGELLVAGLQSLPAQDAPGPLSWMLALVSLSVAWHCVRRSGTGRDRPLRA